MSGVSGAYSVYDPYSDCGNYIFFIQLSREDSHSNERKQHLRRVFPMPENPINKLLTNKGWGRGKPLFRLERRNCHDLPAFNLVEVMVAGSRP
jgi:hypothetical protein